jgi:predicted GTPase
MSFYQSDLSIVVADPHRAGAEGNYYPSEVNVRLADVVVINKIDTSEPKKIQEVRENMARINPKAVIVEAASPVRVEDPDLIRGKRILAVEDGPTLTHGEMKIGAAIVAAQKLGASEIVDPRPWLTGRLEETFRIYPNIGTLLPAMGYGDEQVKDLEKTINKVDCDAVIVGTPIDLRRVVKIKKPSTRVYYDLEEIGEPKLIGILDEFVKKHLPGRV